VRVRGKQRHCGEGQKKDRFHCNQIGKEFIGITKFLDSSTKSREVEESFNRLTAFDY
jgi:hypothetical protein